jgi:putative addiction module component (TIGR02574 family)
MKTIDLEKSVLRLPPRKRAAVASRILESLTSEAERTHSTVWSEEADARIAAYDAGKISSKSADQVLAYRGKSAK